jgi:hypothetical protein
MSSQDPTGFATRWSINAPTVVSETVEGETIVVNLASGAYYSLLGAAARIWSGLITTGRLEDAVHTLAQTYAAPAETLAQDAASFLQELIKEQLLVPAGEQHSLVNALPASVAQAQGEWVAYVPPVMEKFDDMQEMLVLDPIHEVSAAGWPHQAP